MPTRMFFMDEKVRLLVDKDRQMSVFFVIDVSERKLSKPWGIYSIFGIDTRCDGMLYSLC